MQLNKQLGNNHVLEIGIKQRSICHCINTTKVCSASSYFSAFQLTLLVAKWSNKEIELFMPHIQTDGAQMMEFMLVTKSNKLFISAQ